MTTLIQSLSWPPAFTLIISGYQWTQVGFDEAYTHVLVQTQTEEQIVFGLHPEITLGLIGTMGLWRTWFASTLENFSSPSSHTKASTSLSTRITG